MVILPRRSSPWVPETNPGTIAVGWRFTTPSQIASGGYRDAANMARRLDNDEKRECLVDTPSGAQRMVAVSFW